jgi:hypothetical protein
MSPEENVMRTTLSVLAALIATVAPLAGQEDTPAISPEREAAILRLLEVSGQAEMMQQAMVAMIDQMRPALPQLPDEFFTEFKQAALGDEMIDLIVPVMERHYTDEEIAELTRFFESPIGRKLVEKQPVVQQDAMAVGQAWGQRKAVEIVERLQERGVIPPDGEAGP